MRADETVRMSVGRFVLLTDIIGLLSVLLALLAWRHWPLPLPTPEIAAQPLSVISCAALAAIGQIVVVRVRHGGTYEELGFFEVVIAAGLCLMPAGPLLVSVLAGVLLAEVAVRREPIKMAFNLGSYSAASSAMVMTYLALNGDTPPVQWRMVVAMFAGLLVFEAVNLAFIAELLHRFNSASVNRMDVVRDEWQLSGFMAVGGVGVGLVGVALWMYAPALLPFVALPVAALRYAYDATAEHAQARERNRWLISLGGLLAGRGHPDRTLSAGADAVRQVFGAPHVETVVPWLVSGDRAGAGAQMVERLRSDPGPRPLAPGELPHNWTSGSVILLDAGAGGQGALMLGSAETYRRSSFGRSRGWALEDSDKPVLGALVAALGSAVAAGMAYDALTEETAKLTAVVDNTSDGIAVVDDSGRVQLWSQTMARMTGVHSEALTDVGPEAHPDVVATLLRAAVGELGATSSHVHLERQDGEELDVVVTSVRVAEAVSADDGEGGGWVSILTVHDETRERRVERMKTDFIATISHELRTPITPIKGYAHLLATRGDRVPPAKRQAALETISDRADHLARLVDDLLLASRVSDGARLAVEIGLEDLQDVITTAVGMFPHMSDRIEVAPLPAPITVQCDRVRAVQCLSNLIGNAGKYTPPETVVEVSVVATALQVAIHVRDHGPGIPPAEQARVFERFYRIEDPFTMKTGGAGLGLHIARELAVAMGGGLSLETPPGGGADFVLHLVTAEAPPVGKAAGASQAQIAPAAGRDGHPGRGGPHPGVSSGGVRGPAGGMGRVPGATIHPADQ